MPEFPKVKVYASHNNDLPDGWKVTFDYVSGMKKNRRTALLTGPYKYLDDAIEAVKYCYDNISSLTPSTSSGSAIATIRIEYILKLEADPIQDEIAPPTYDITPVSERVSLRAHPIFESMQYELSRIDSMIDSGDIVTLQQQFTRTSLQYKYAALRLSGVDAYDSVGYMLLVTRYFKVGDLPNLSTDLANVNKVFTWANVKTRGIAMPGDLSEPKGTVATVDGIGNLSGNAVTSLEWRLDNVSIHFSEDQSCSATWYFHGAWMWSKLLYPGGSWDPLFEASNNNQPSP